MAQARVEEDEAVEVRIVRSEITRLVDSMVIIHNGADLHGRPYAVLHNRTVRVLGSTRREGKFVIAVHHALGSDENQMESRQGEEMGQLHPGISRQRRLSASTKDKDTHRGRLRPETLDRLVASSLRRMQGIAKCRQTLQALDGEAIPDMVRAQLVKNAADRERIGQQPSRLSHAPVIVDSFELTGIHKRVPVGHVDHGVIHLRTGVVELVEVAA